MPVKLFILGRPGSGKSSAARHIIKLVRNRDNSYARVNDYNILREMYEEEKEHNRFQCFRPIDNDGFDVVDFEVLDIALGKVRNLAEEHASSANCDLVIIEFARSDYSIALQKFDSDFLRDAYFLFLDADLDTCVKRVYDRTAHPLTSDDNFISDEMIRNYYQLDNRLYVMSNLAGDYGLDNKQVKVFENTGTLADFITMVDNFVEFILDQETHKVRQTDSIQIIPSFVSDTELAK